MRYQFAAVLFLFVAATYAWADDSWVGETVIVKTPDTKFVDPHTGAGKKALVLAQKACELTNWKDASVLESFAAACAETGDFEQAVRWQTKALEDKDFAAHAGDAARKRLELYKQRKPCRED